MSKLKEGTSLYVFDEVETPFTVVPGDSYTCLKELARGHRAEERNLDTKKWEEEIPKLYADLLSYKPADWQPLEGLGLDKAIPLVLRSLCVGGGSTTITGWNRTFQFPKDVNVGKGKKELLYYMDHDPELLPKIISFVKDVFGWMCNTHKQGVAGYGMLVHTIPKEEPYKKKKLEDGQHRSIQFPDLSVSILDRVYSEWVDSQGRHRTFDELMALFPADKDVGWLIGGDVDKVIHLAKSKFPEGSELLSLDVSGWDRSLPIDVIRKMFHTTVRHPSVAESLTNGLCGKGIYKTGGCFFKFVSPHSSVWCSGCPKTLSGNCLMHGALMRSLGMKGFVQGDDAVSLNSPEIASNYLAVGLKMKPEAQFVGTDEFEFVKLHFNLKTKELTLLDTLVSKAFGQGLRDKIELGIEGINAGNQARSSLLKSIGWTYKFSLSEENKQNKDKLDIEIVEA